MSTFCDKGNVALHLADLRILTQFKSVHYEGSVYVHQTLGRVLVLDGEIQHVEAWAPLYHEPVVHLPAAFIKTPQTALILGGGSFYAATEMLKYKSIKRILMLDHDEMLIEKMSEIYEHAACARKDPRLELRVQDAFEAIPLLGEQFDIIINDSVDLLKIGGRNIFAELTSILSPQGVCSDLVYRHLFDGNYANRTLALLRDRYNTVCSLIFAAEYPGILHLLALWGGTPLLCQECTTSVNCEHEEWINNPETNPCRYFDPRFIRYYLHLPKFVRVRFE